MRGEWGIFVKDFSRVTLAAATLSFSSFSFWQKTRTQGARRGEETVPPHLKRALDQRFLLWAHTSFTLQALLLLLLKVRGTELGVETTDWGFSSHEERRRGLWLANNPQQAYRPRVVVLFCFHPHPVELGQRSSHSQEPVRLCYSPADTAASGRWNWLQLHAPPPPHSKHNDQANLQSFSCCWDHIDGHRAACRCGTAGRWEGEMARTISWISWTPINSANQTGER